MKLALHSITYAGFFYEGGALTIEQIIDRARRFGYDAVEVMAKRPLCSPFDFDTARAKALRKHADKKGVDFCMMAGYIDLPQPASLDREKELVFAKESFRLARDLGAPSVRVYAGGEHVHEGATAWQQWNWCVEGCKALAPLAEAFKVDMALEWHIGLVQSTDALLDLAEQIGSERVKVVLDPPHLSMRGESAAEAVKKAGRLLVHSHVADFTRGRPFMTYQAVPELAVRQVMPMNHVPLGTGVVEIAPFVQACKEIGFRGSLAFEVCTPFHRRHRMPTVKDVDKLVEQGAEYLRKLL